MNIGNENTSFTAPIVYDVTPFTQVDFPNKLAAIVWFCGCNMRCAYCYNDAIVFAKEGRYTFEDVLAFLHRRIGLLEGVVFSGGEATLYNLKPLLSRVKELGFATKLDTNGSNPKLLASLLQEGLLDYVALDYKAPHAQFRKITGSSLHQKTQESLGILLRNDTPFEVRMTLHSDLLDVDDCNALIDELVDLGYTGALYIQKFRQTPSNIGNLTQPKTPFASDLLHRTLDVVWR